MKILISTLGSRGDVQPYLALGVGLQNAGHTVTIAAPASFIDWITSYGVGGYPVRFNPNEVMRTLSKSVNPIQAMRTMRAVMKTGVMDALDDCWQAAQDTDFLIQTGTGSNALEVAARRGIPVAFSFLVPMQPTRAYPSFLVPFRYSLGARYNYWTYRVVQHILWHSIGGPTANRWRTHLGLPAWRSEEEMLQYARRLGVPALYGYSPSFLPKPADWKENQHVTGYWFLNAQPGWQPPPDLLDFLDRGSPPLYVGFGSMSQENPERVTQLAVRALALSGQRGVVMTHIGAQSKLESSPAVFFLDEVPHSWLFPQMAAVVHHGGAGTTGAGLRAGVPSIITPFGGDQRAWADLLVKAGVGLWPSSGRRLTAEKLAEAIRRAVNDPGMHSRATALGEKIRAENGIARALEVIGRYEAWKN